MRDRIVPVVIHAVAAAAVTPAEPAAAGYGSESGFGLGLVLGEPTGISMKLFLGAGHAIQGTAAFELVHRDRFLFIVNYLWHPSTIVSTSAFDLGWHVGVGGFVGIWFDDYRCDRWSADPRRCEDWDDDGAGFGAHFPVGLDMMFRGAPIELFLEAAPGLWIFPGTDFSIFGGFGARYFF